MFSSLRILKVAPKARIWSDMPVQIRGNGTRRSWTSSPLMVCKSLMPLLLFLRNLSNNCEHTIDFCLSYTP